MNDCPSNSAAEAFPNAESVREPDTISTRSDWINAFASCVFCSGTITNCVTSVAESSEDPKTTEISYVSQPRIYRKALTDTGPTLAIPKVEERGRIV